MREANTLTAVAAKHGVHPSQVKEWRKQFKSAGLDGFRKGTRRAAEQAETIRGLHAKIGELTMERDFFQGR